MPAPTLYNYMVFFVILAPPILAMSILSAAALSGQAWVGLIYIFGLLFLYFPIWPMVSSMIGEYLPSGKDGAKVALCTLFNTPFINNAWASPALYIMIYFYTFWYVMWPTIGLGESWNTTKYIFVIGISILMALTLHVRYCVIKCLPQEPAKLLIAIITAFLIGTGWGIFGASAAENALPDGAWSFPPAAGPDRQTCTKPDGEDMVCTISKDGQPIGTL